MKYYGPCRGIAAATAFFWFLVWMLGIISISIPDWWWIIDSTSGRHEGLWSTCWAHYCVPANQYGSDCSSLLNVVRAFGVMSIIFGFFAFVDALMLFYCITRCLPFGLASGVLTFIFSLITWSVYLGFKGQCVVVGGGAAVLGLDNTYPDATYAPYYSTSSSVGVAVGGPEVNLGSGWGLSVAVWCLSVLALILHIVWCLKCRNCPCPQPCCPVPCCDPCMTMAAPVCDPCLLGGAPVGQPIGGMEAAYAPLDVGMGAYGGGATMTMPSTGATMTQPFVSM